MHRAFVPFAHLMMVAVALAGLLQSPARAQSTVFTYQGELTDVGAPASGLHDFRFRLFDAASGGSQVGATLCTDNVNVVTGVFTVQLDFRAAVRDHRPAPPRDRSAP